jgi:hypothetical protein
VKARLEAQEGAAEVLLTKCSQLRHKLTALQQVKTQVSRMPAAVMHVRDTW